LGSNEEKAMVKKKDVREGQMIHVRLPKDVHRLLRVRVAEDETRIQDWVAALIEKELKGGRGK
jgi:predicted HicB family RNase H-like nuclease